MRFVVAILIIVAISAMALKFLPAINIGERGYGSYGDGNVTPEELAEIERQAREAAEEAAEQAEAAARDSMPNSPSPGPDQ